MSGLAHSKGDDVGLGVLWYSNLYSFAAISAPETKLYRQYVSVPSSSLLLRSSI